MSISVHSMNAARVARPSIVCWLLIAGAVLLVLAFSVVHGDPGASNGTSIGMIVP
jgi:hypothetical protein